MSSRTSSPQHPGVLPSWPPTPDTPVASPHVSALGAVTGARAATVGVDTARTRPLLVTVDDALLDEILRLAALAGTELEVVPDAVGARPYWSGAPFVVVGEDAAGGCARARLPCRRDVVLVTGAGAPVAGGPESEPTRGRPSELAWQLAADLGADQVVELPYAESWLVRRFTEAYAVPSTAKVVATVPGSGGAGASVLAAGLATTAVRRGVRPLLVDADPLGGGLDVLLGWEERAGLRWPDLTEASGAMSVDGLYSALPRSGELVVLSWDRSDFLDVPLGAVDAVIDAGRRGSDLVVVDLPRRLDDAGVRVLQAADLVLLVARPDVRGCAAAARTSAQLRLHSATVEAVVRGPAPGNLRAEDVCTALGVPLAGSLRPESGLPAALDRGEAPAATGRGPLASLCRRVLGRLDIVTSDAA